VRSLSKIFILFCLFPFISTAQGDITYNLLSFFPYPFADHFYSYDFDKIKSSLLKDGAFKQCFVTVKPGKDHCEFYSVTRPFPGDLAADSMIFFMVKCEKNQPYILKDTICTYSYNSVRFFYKERSKANKDMEYILKKLNVRKSDIAISKKYIEVNTRIYFPVNPEKSESIFWERNVQIYLDQLKSWELSTITICFN
jgi:hypothetical protein